MGNTNCTLDQQICCEGGTGVLLSGSGSPFPSYENSSPFAMSTVYCLLLCWSFLGVAIAADVFMSAIEQITSSLKYVKHKSKDGSIKRFRIRTWNATVANLTLMALGSSAPEILLSAIELMGNQMKSGDLGPSTIVGSAAFNLMVIVAVCVLSIPASDTRKIAQPIVYGITAFFSVFAYVWLIVILSFWTPDVITIAEAIITLLYFPFVVWLAFVADKWNGHDPSFRTKWKRRMGFHNAEESVRSEILPSEMLLEVKRPDGTPLDGEELMQMIKRLRRTTSGLAMDEEKAVSAVYAQIASQQPKSRAFYRVNATRMITHGHRVDSVTNIDPSTVPPQGSPLTPRSMKSFKLASSSKVEPQPEPEPIRAGHSVVEFAAETYAVVEAAQLVTVSVLRVGDDSKEVGVDYETIDGTARAGSDFEGVKGTLHFKPGQTTHDITIKIFDDDEIEPDEVFSIKLTSITNGDASIGSMATTNVTIINDDFPGTFCLPSEEIEAKEGCGVCQIVVNRQQGCSGKVTMAYRTLDGTAIGGKNYVKSEGSLEWAHQDVDPKVIEVPIIDDDVMQGRKMHFDVELHSASGGAVFDAKTDGASERSLARITIVDDDAIKSIADRAIGMLGMNQQTVKLGASSWGEQFREAVSLGGEDDDGNPTKPSPLEYVLFVFSLPWKVLVAFVPPATIGGGYPCFAIAIIFIGILTAAIGDLASLMGCAMGIHKAVVAIIFVALGTSLPDTFASKSAAQGDPTADAAIGNVTGSNGVNVFLGLGISWLLGAIYWTVTDGMQDPLWVATYAETIEYYAKRGEAVPKGLVVPAGDLSFSVLVFSVCAVLCIATLGLRRKLYDAELGGKARWPTAIFFVTLWVIYVVLSSMTAYKIICPSGGVPHPLATPPYCEE